MLSLCAKLTIDFTGRKPEWGTRVYRLVLPGVGRFYARPIGLGWYVVGVNNLQSAEQLLKKGHASELRTNEMHGLSAGVEPGTIWAGGAAVESVDGKSKKTKVKLVNGKPEITKEYTGCQAKATKGTGNKIDYVSCEAFMAAIPAPAPMQAGEVEEVRS